MRALSWPDSWQGVPVVAPDGISQTHVVPVCDIKPHMLSEKCACKPDEDDTQPDLWRHSAFDTRHGYEAGRALH